MCVLAYLYFRRNLVRATIMLSYLTPFASFAVLSEAFQNSKDITTFLFAEILTDVFDGKTTPVTDLYCGRLFFVSPLSSGAVG